MTSLDHRFLRRLGAAATAAALVLPVLPAAATDAPVAPPARTLELACPADRVTGEDFSDTAGSVHEDSIRCLAWYGIAKGSADGAYAGQLAVTRAQLATFLARVLEQAGIELPASAADAFSDDEASAHEASLNALAALGIVKGDAAGEVSPDDAVRRDQMASLLIRALELIEGDDVADALEDYFEDDDDNVHSSAINALAGLGIAAGRGDGVFDPSSDVLREQLATFLMRLVDRLVEHEQVRIPLTLRVLAEEVTAGAVVTAEVVGDDIDTVALRGCGVDGPVADENADAAGVQFSFTVPAASPAEPDSSGTGSDGLDEGGDASDGAADDSTDAPDDSTDAPDESTDAPDDSTDAPDDSTDAPDDSAEAGDEASEDCELEVVVSLVDGTTVTLEANLEPADAEDGAADEDDAPQGDDAGTGTQDGAAGGDTAGGEAV